MFENDAKIAMSFAGEGYRLGFKDGVKAAIDIAKADSYAGTSAYGQLLSIEKALLELLSKVG